MPSGVYVRTERQLINQRLAHLGQHPSDETKKKLAKALEKHGDYRTKLNGIWRNMKQRCLNPNHRSFHRYGGRGITFCQEWSEFVPFRDWAMVNGYEEGLSIDRINNDGNYEPDNCQWTTLSANAKKDYKILGGNMSFSGADKKYDKKNGTFELIDILGEVQKNKFSTVRVAKVKCWGAEYIQVQVWKTENDKSFAAKGQNIIIKPEVANRIGKILVDV